MSQTMTRSRRRALAALTATLLLTLVVVAIAPASAQPPRPATWGPTDEPVGPTSGPDASPKSEPAVAIDPTNPDRMIASSIDYDRTPGPVCCGWRAWFGIGIQTSSDGGRTWVDRGNAPLVDDDGKPMTCGGRVGVDPTVTFDANGVAYLAHLSYSLDDSFGVDPSRTCPDWTLAVHTSDDGGATWNAPIVVDRMTDDGDCPPDRDSFAAHPTEGVVYLVWSRLCSVTQTFFSASHDGGSTWSEPVRVSKPDQDEYGVSPAVTPDGTIYVGYYRQSDFNGCVAVADLVFGQKVVSKEAAVAISRDGGATWTHRDLAPMCDQQTQLVLDQPFFGGTDFSWPSLAADPDSGLVGIAWANRDGNRSTVHAVVSLDGGNTWSEQRVVSAEGPGSTVMPELAAGGGMLRLTYLRMLSSGQFDVEHRESADGIEWSDPVVLDTEQSCNCWGGANGPGIGASSIGDYIGLDARAGRLVAVWPDNRDVSVPQNIYARVATY